MTVSRSLPGHALIGAVCVFFLFSAAGPALAQAASDGAAAPTPPPAAAPAAVEGKALYRTKTCIACHGKDGAKAIQNYPDIAAQDAAYLYAQMKDIASGARVSGKDERGYPRTQAMKDVMHLTADNELKAIADWLATLPPAPVRKPEEPIAQDVLDKGKAAYTQGACQTCHGPNGLKPLATYPVIGGQKKEYLKLQMADMRDGTRANGKSKLMLPFAKKLTDENIELIATYLSQVERPKP